MVLVLLNISLECSFGATKKKAGKKIFSLSFWFGFGSLSTFRFFLYLRELFCDKLKKKEKKNWGGEVVQKSIQKSSKKKKKLERLCVCWRATAARARETERQRETERDTERDGE